MFEDRTDAGRRLAARLADYDLPEPLVLGLPRGGLPVALPVADALDAELDVLVVRKIGAPENPECALGAVGEDGVLVMDHDTRRHLRVTDDVVRRTVQRERAELERRVGLYRQGSRRLGLAGRNVILVDDGLATGATVAAAVRVARRAGARHLTVAVPVGSREAVDRIGDLADDVVCLEMPESFWAVGQHYRDFTQVSDQQVIDILASRPRETTRHTCRSCDDDVLIPADDVMLPGHLTLPDPLVGIVVVVHGSGSDRTSPRNRVAAAGLHAAGIGTLLFDLQAAGEHDEELTVSAGARRLRDVVAWLATRPETAGMPIGYYGASTGAAVALAAAADDPAAVRAVVSRGGRPDLAASWLPRVVTPTLLIVGGRDYAVVDVNREADHLLPGPHLLEVVKGATHLFEEPGALPRAVSLARSWFLHYLPRAGEGHATREAS